MAWSEIGVDIRDAVFRHVDWPGISLFPGKFPAIARIPGFRWQRDGRIQRFVLLAEAFGSAKETPDMIRGTI